MGINSVAFISLSKDVSMSISGIDTIFGEKQDFIFWLT